MTAGERAYLLSKAHKLWALQKTADARGEEFVPSMSFDELSNGLWAQSRIYVMAAGKPAQISLCFRHAPGDEVAASGARDAARIFFPTDDYWAMPEVESGGMIYIGFSSATIPPALF